MKIKELLTGLNYEIIKGSDEIHIHSVQYDSRKVKQNDIFFCIEGYQMDGHKFAQNAIDRGAKAVVCTKGINIISDITLIKVEDTRKALALSASAFYGHPEKKLKIIGVTGTNGKTTTTYMIKSVLENIGYKVGLIGTIANYIGENRIETSRTTPESLELFQIFNSMVEANINYCVMEVSSHSLFLNRVYGIEFQVGIFTNLTQDHLDFHKTFENYYKAKLILFNNSRNIVVNTDDEYGRRILEDVNKNSLTYSIQNHSDLKPTDINMSSKGINFSIKYNDCSERVYAAIPGKYNIYNALGCIGALLYCGLTLKDIKEGFEKFTGVPGRCEIATAKYNLGFDVVIDYAHTPDGLQNILNTAREFTKGNLISVFGCGGDRDKLKRPIMGQIGTDLSDTAIITSDNPRTEEPMAIIEDITKGIHKNNYIVIGDRRSAIKKALGLAKKDDVIVIAGKGHENYQILKDRTIHFDEREVIRELIEELF